jgi:predicted GIY-YIG superfamily endonuclease
MPYSLYVIELSRGVLDVARFRKRNPDWREDKPCVYVGQTALTPEERFEQHQAGYKCNSLTHRYGVRLRPKLVVNRGPFETRAEALEAETALAGRLRMRGYAVWSN